MRITPTNLYVSVWIFFACYLCSEMSHGFNDKANNYRNKPLALFHEPNCIPLQILCLPSSLSIFGPIPSPPQRFFVWPLPPVSSCKRFVPLECRYVAISPICSEHCNLMISNNLAILKTCLDTDNTLNWYLIYLFSGPHFMHDLG